MRTPPALPDMADRHRGGFTLIEVALALGLATFVIVALVGLLGVLVENSRRAVEETRLVGLLSSLNSYLRSRDFDQLPQENILYFSGESERLASSSAPAVFYRVSIAEASLPGASPRRQILKIGISYPAPGFEKQHSTLMSRYDFE